MTTESETFGGLLRRLRTAAELTQEEFAERAGLSVRSVSDIERGLNQSPYRATVDRLIEALSLSHEDERALRSTISRRRGPARREPERALTNLPVEPTPLIGREADEAAVVHLLRWEGRRLLTLTGTGGVGKTRLALRVAGTVAEEFSAGSVFVSLAAIRDPALVATAIAATLEVSEDDERPLQHRLIEALADRELLLLLDNFEQVVSAGTLVGALLDACPKLKVLATSRIPLHIRGEQEIDVSHLGLPNQGEPLGPDELGHYPAVALFIARAQAVKPAFELTEQSGPVVLEICRRLDGLPLAIELAAARIKALSPGDILARLDHRLDILTGGARDQATRQETMRNTIDWSFNLLTPAQQRLFRRLAVFAGEWDLEAAEAVCASTDWPDIVDGLHALVDKSLVRVHETPEGATRYGMLQTIREYGLEQLDQSRETDSVRRRHAMYFLRMVEWSEPILVGPERDAAVGRLEQEYENAREALGWSREIGEADMGLRLAGGLWRFWYTQNRLSEGRAWLRDMLSMPHTDTPASVRAKAHFGAGALAYALGDLADAQQRFETSLELRRDQGEAAHVAEVLNGLGAVATSVGEYQRAAVHLEESAAIRRTQGEPFALGATLTNLANVALYQGHYSRASELYEESLGLYRVAGQAAAVANALNNLALIAQDCGKYDRAAHFVNESLAISREQRDTRGIAQALNSLGTQAIDRGAPQDANGLFLQSGELFESLGDRDATAMILCNLATVALQEGRCAEAKCQAEESAVLSRASGNRRMEAYALVALGDVARAHRDDPAAAGHYQASLSLRRAVGHPIGVADSFERLAGLACAQDEWETAVQQYGIAASLRDRFEIPLPPSRRSEYERDIDQLRRKLGDGVFTAAWEVGREQASSELPGQQEH